MQGVGLAEQISVMIKTGEGRRRHLGHWVLLRPGGHSGQGFGMGIACSEAGEMIRGHRMGTLSGLPRVIRQRNREGK